MPTVTIEDAQARLRELVHQLAPGEEVAIVEDSRRVATLIGERTTVHQRPEPGLCKGMITIVADDHEHLQHFAEYMP